MSDILLLGAQVSEGAHFVEVWLPNGYNFHRRLIFDPDLALERARLPQ